MIYILFICYISYSISIFVFPLIYSQYSNFSRLHLKNGVELEQINNSWVVYNLDKEFNHSSFKFEEERNCYILSCENLIDELIPLVEVLNLYESNSDI